MLLWVLSSAHLEYNLGLYQEAQRSIERALRLGHEDSGPMQIRLARIHMRKHKADTSNLKRDISGALAAFCAALSFTDIALRPVHYLEVASAYLKLNETQQAIKALATILIRWPGQRATDPSQRELFMIIQLSAEATMAQETCAQTLLARGQPLDALPHYQVLLINTSAPSKFDSVDGDDHAEVDLPMARNILGNESIFLQMGLCYEIVGNVKVAKKAYLQAWNKLVERRKGELQGSLSAKAEDSDYIEAILGHANAALRVVHPRGGAQTTGAPGSKDAASLPGDSPYGSLERLRTPSPGYRENVIFFEKPGSRSVLASTRAGRSPNRGRIRSDREINNFTAAAEEAKKKRGFKLWLEEPYTWYRIGEALLSGKCFALALVFLDKTLDMLPPGLEQQEKEKHLPVYKRRRRKLEEPELRAPAYFRLSQLRLLRAEAFFQLGRFSDAHAEAEHARELDPLGERVKRLCPRLMALHSEDARSQYAHENLATVCIQRAWRGHWKLHVLKDLVTRQIAAMRTQRFMRRWIRYNHWLILRRIAASATELSDAKGAHSRGLGVTATAFIAKRLQVMIEPAILVQRAVRVFLARQMARRRREAIVTLQAFQRGCQGRAALRAVLEEGCGVLHMGRNTGSHSDDGKDIVSGFRSVNQNLNHTSSENVSLKECTAPSVGNLIRYSLPMDAGCPGGFGLPDLSAFLWDSSGKENDDLDAAAAHSAAGGRISYTGTVPGGGVFELSVRALKSTRGDGSVSLERKQLPLAWPDWVSPAIASEISLAQALDCSMLVINCPSFCSVCSRRLFSRIGRLKIEAAERQNPVPFSISRVAKGDIARDQEERHNTARIATPGKDPNGKRPRVLGEHLECIMVLGYSPVGNAALLELSSALQHGSLSCLSTLVIGGPACRVGPRGINSLARALSSAGCLSLRHLSLSYCCLGRRLTRRVSLSSSPSLSLSSSLALKRVAATAAAHEAWGVFFRHLQYMSTLSTLSLQSCGLTDSDMSAVSIAIQTLPVCRLRCLRLNRNCVGAPGLRILLRALTSRRIRIPALWLRQQQPAMVESQVRETVNEAFAEGLWAEVEFERPMDAMGGRTRLLLMEHTSESEGLGRRAVKHTTSNIYLGS